MSPSLWSDSLRVGGVGAASRFSRSFIAATALVPAAVVLVVSLLERQAQLSGALDRTLLGGTFGIALPLVAYVLVDHVSQGARLDSQVSPLLRAGYDRRACVAANLGLVTMAAGLSGASLGLMAVVGSRGPSWISELAPAMWIGALAGACYAAVLGTASLIGKNGNGRAWVIFLDWVLGSTGGTLALLWPRAHVANLLGGVAPLNMDQSSAALALATLLLTSLGIAWVRTDP